MRQRKTLSLAAFRKPRRSRLRVDDLLATRNDRHGSSIFSGQMAQYRAGMTSTGSALRDGFLSTSIRRQVRRLCYAAPAGQSADADVQRARHANCLAAFERTNCPACGHEPVRQRGSRRPCFVAHNGLVQASKIVRAHRKRDRFCLFRSGGQIRLAADISGGQAGPLIVFTGQMDYRPNIEAVVEFCAPDVFPLDPSAAIPDARFARRRPKAPVHAVERARRNDPASIVTGGVADIRSWLAAADRRRRAAAARARHSEQGARGDGDGARPWSLRQ